MTGQKFGRGLCGVCSVHVNGVATRSCIATVASVANANVSTIESLVGTRVGRAAICSTTTSPNVQDEERKAIARHRAFPSHRTIGVHCQAMNASPIPVPTGVRYTGM